MERRFKKLYCVPSEKIQENVDMKYLVFVWKNGDYYFSTKVRDKKVETLENVVLSDKYIKETFIDLQWWNKKCNYLLRL